MLEDMYRSNLVRGMPLALAAYMGHLLDFTDTVCKVCKVWKAHKFAAADAGYCSHQELDCHFNAPVGTV